MTLQTLILAIFVLLEYRQGLNRLHIVAFTHRNISVNDIGQLHIDPEYQKERLVALSKQLNLSELMYLTTCNRIEFAFVLDDTVNPAFIANFLQSLYPNLETELQNQLVASADIFHGIDAVQHQLSVASSVESMVVGEREIITQVRNAYDTSHANGLTGDILRIMIRHTIETAKKVYTKTNIATRPVSVVSLAYHQLRDMNVSLDSRILIVGAGVTNTNMGRFLKKHGFTKFNVFNRTFQKGEQLAKDLGGTAHPLKDLAAFDKGFDIIITCTAAEHHVLTPEIYRQLERGEMARKVVIDIAIPQDLSPEIKATHNVHHISVEELQKISNENLKARSTEVAHVHEIIAEAIFEFKEIYKERSIEIAMSAVPSKVKEIKNAAMNEVFKQDLSNLDDEAREVLENILGYMEKKYISMPMLMAKEILLKQRL
ncbi:MAG: glutamyl-tRNA reductase [Flavobacteriaceae bacterium]|jgi:glutamyl-tRNA reductase